MATLNPRGGDDRVFTPQATVLECLTFLNEFKSFQKAVKVLEPASGEGAFSKELLRVGKDVIECEISNGTNFFEFNDKVDFIVTNPPWSLTRKFLVHSMSVSDNIAFLIPINHLIGLKARMRDMKQKGFWVTDVKLITTPKEFPQSGFQLGFCLIQRTDVLETRFY